MVCRPPDKASAKTFKDYIDDAACPPLNIGDIINLQNGLDTSVLSALDDKLQAQPADSDGNRYLDTMLPVVDTDKFNQFETIKILSPSGSQALFDTPKGIHGTVIALAELQSALPGGGRLARWPRLSWSNKPRGSGAPPGAEPQ